jgi:hypothetical protein
MEGVAWRNSQRFNTNIKVGDEFEQRHLEVKFGLSKFSEPHLWGRKTDVEFFSTPNQKKMPNFEFISKSYGYFTEPPPS